MSIYWKEGHPPQDYPFKEKKKKVGKLMNRKEAYEELSKSGYSVGIKLPITVMPIVKTSFKNEEENFIYFLTLNEIPAIQELLYKLQTAVITLENELTKRTKEVYEENA